MPSHAQKVLPYAQLTIVEQAAPPVGCAAGQVLGMQSHRPWLHVHSTSLKRHGPAGAAQRLPLAGGSAPAGHEQGPNGLMPSQTQVCLDAGYVQT